MQQLVDKVKELFANNQVNLVIGYRKGKPDRARPIFVDNPELADFLIFDQTCVQNLVTYYHKPEVKSFGKIAFVSNLPAVKTVLQLAAENQISEGNVSLLAFGLDGKMNYLANFAEMEKFVADNKPTPPSEMVAKIKDIAAKPREERWNFWVDELSKCIKCYACRSACPLCYCTQCTVECNQPQWIPVMSNGQGNLEWQMLRVMHLAGRCIGCGECTRACPMEIPITLMNARLNQEIAMTFGQQPGLKHDLDYAMSSFKVEDKEHFIR